MILQPYDLLDLVPRIGGADTRVRRRHPAPAGEQPRATSVLASIWDEAPELAFTRERTRDDPRTGLWGFCGECPFRDVCLGGCTFTAHAFFGRPGNDPYCHFRDPKRSSRSAGSPCPHDLGHLKKRSTGVSIPGPAMRRPHEPPTKVRETDHALHDHAQERSADRSRPAAADGARPADGRVHRRVRQDRPLHRRRRPRREQDADAARLPRRPRDRDPRTVPRRARAARGHAPPRGAHA